MVTKVVTIEIQPFEVSLIHNEIEVLAAAIIERAHTVSLLEGGDFVRNIRDSLENLADEIAAVDDLDSVSCMQKWWKT